MLGLAFLSRMQVDDDELLLARMDAGLFTLQRAALILGALWAAGGVASGTFPYYHTIRLVSAVMHVWVAGASRRPPIHSLTLHRLKWCC